MDDPLIRLAVVAAAGLSVASWAWWRSRRVADRSTRAIWDPGLAAGTYLFTSSTCGDCVVARQKMGRIPFIEIGWEDSPELFAELGVTEVPSTLIVREDGTGTWHRGVPDQ